MQMDRFCLKRRWAGLLAMAGMLALPGVVVAQMQHVAVAPPGDSPAQAGPLAQGLSARFTRRDLAKAMKLVADWQLQRMPVQAQTDWTWAALYTGFMAVPTEVAGEKYRNAMLGIATRLEWQPGPRVMHADDQAVGQMYMEQYFQYHLPEMKAAMQARLRAEMAAPDDPNKPLWWWCDALFMAPPVFADMSTVTSDGLYRVYMDHEWDVTTNLLYDRKEHLYSRDATFLDKREKNGRKIFWSRGNGWVMAGLARVIQQMPVTGARRALYEQQLREMAAAVLKVQGKDGLWRPGLLDPESYPLPEVSGSAFITYALAYGVNEGILDRATYEPAVHRAWKGLLSHVYADGRLGSMQPVGAAPGAFTETSSYVYGVGAYLLAGSEIYRTAKR